MKSLEFSDFVGLDVRNLPEVSDPQSLRSATNVEVTTGKGLKSRDQLRLYAVVDEASRGLYVVNDALHCALPYPSFSVPVPRPPVDIVYDILADSSGQPHQATVLNVESVASWNTRPYIDVRVQTPGGIRWRHYFPAESQPAASAFVTVQAGPLVTIPGVPPTIGAGATIWFFNVVGSFLVVSRLGDVFTLDSAPATFTTPRPSTIWFPMNNQVALPFEPGPPVVTAAEKIFAADVAGRDVWFSSTANGPTDWLATADAGFLPTSNHVDGDQPIRGLGVYRTQLAVFFDLVAQIWTIDPDPANMAINANVGGAGTKYPNTVQNVMGDLFYFSNGGFRSMDAVITTGQPKDNDLGTKIQQLTQFLAPTNAAAVWSPWRQQYACVLDQQGFIFTYSPTGDTRGWGRWELPWPVAATVEWRNKLYFRRVDSGEIWVMDPLYTGEAEFSWDAQFNFSDVELAHYVKHFKMINPHMRGTADLAYATNPFDLTELEPMGTFLNETSTIGKMATNCQAIHLGPKWSGTGQWLLDAYILWFDKGNML